MRNVTLKDVIIIMQRAFNAMDKRLLDHGEKVSYILLKLLQADGSYTDDEVLKLCTVAIFHDIGAYKVSERNKLIEIDSIAPINHAIYGSLFIKYFSPVSEMHKVVLGHHFTDTEIKEKNIKDMPNEALLMGLADYISLLHLKHNKINKSLIINRTKAYKKENIDLYLKALETTDFNKKLADNTYKDELIEFFDKKYISREEIINYIKMLTYAIDFRSEITVKHTIVVQAMSYEVAKLMNFDDDLCIKIKISAMIHDIGKIATPINILEKPGKLTDEEFEIMKDHAIIGYKILSNLDIDDIRDIAMAHHEKLDGTGYPFGLKGEEISREARIVAIADIFSALMAVRSYKDEFSKDRIVEILKNMANSNKVDYNIVQLVVENYDYIVERVKQETDDLIKIYEDIKNEYVDLLNKLL
ncbi:MULTISPECIES: HD domain-containing phosphohydrolase [unclassified Clostridium]|uniref:HD-GYP domain-containing protein n=1 Tax=unclassified Clostridium TaxID=2614128 RepID=UPI0013F09297|nr:MULTISPECIES: HD domain-containing phosphohydrolase [unclassified Clostridium]NFG62574.1 HD domain-containing protein [Clostridium botulinum]NFQ10775.1 HD domain-containing protein [Clostridium botulinum]